MILGGDVLDNYKHTVNTYSNNLILKKTQVKQNIWLGGCNC